MPLWQSGDISKITVYVLVRARCPKRAVFIPPRGEEATYSLTDLKRKATTSASGTEESIVDHGILRSYSTPLLIFECSFSSVTTSLYHILGKPGVANVSL